MVDLERDAEDYARRMDAMRYRWLRDTNRMDFRGWGDGENAPLDSIDTLMVFDQPTSSVQIMPGEMDDMIDRAMKKWPI